VDPGLQRDRLRRDPVGTTRRHEPGQISPAHPSRRAADLDLPDGGRGFRADRGVRARRRRLRVPRGRLLRRWRLAGRALARWDASRPQLRLRQSRPVAAAPDRGRCSAEFHRILRKSRVPHVDPGERPADRPGSGGYFAHEPGRLSVRRGGRGLWWPTLRVRLRRRLAAGPDAREHDSLRPHAGGCGLAHRESAAGHCARPGQRGRHHDLRCRRPVRGRVPRPDPGG